MKKSIVLLIAIVMLTGCGVTNSMTENAVQPITFEDPEFENIIRQKINKLEGDITSDAMDKITSLEIKGEQVHSIQGVENCRNLCELVVDSTQVSDFSFVNKLEDLNVFTINNQSVDSTPEFTKCSTMLEINYQKCQINKLSSIMPNVNTVCFTDCTINDFTNQGTPKKVNRLIFSAYNILSLRGISEVYSAVELSIKDSTIESFGEGRMDELSTISLENVKFDNGLESSGVIPQSKQEMKCSITNCSLNKLKGIDKLLGKNEISSLNLSGNNTKDIAGIEQINNLNLLELDLRNNDIRDLSPLCTVLSNVVYLAGNNHIISYSPVADFEGEYLNYVESYSGVDFSIPKSEITFCIIVDGSYNYNEKFEVSPIEIKGQDIFVSPKYFLERFDYNNKVSKDKITLWKNDTKITFINQGRTMIYQGKKYESPYPAVVKNNVTYIPIKYFVEKLGGSIKKSKTSQKNYDYEIYLPKEITNQREGNV